MSQIQFVGDLGLVIGAILALVAGVLAWWVYRKEVNRRGLDPSLKWKLPPLRALAVFLLFLMLTGPVLMHREVIGQVARVLVFVDASESMGLDDQHMEPGRKLLLVADAGWLPAGKVDPQIIDAIAQLDEARRIATATTGGDRAALKQAIDAFAKHVEAARASVAGANLSAASIGVPVRGSITREVWTGAGGTNVRDPRSIDRATEKAPSQTALESRFHSPANFGDNYLQRMRGLIHPPATGDYRFQIHSDDASALYLSTDDKPETKKLIAYQTASTSINDWPAGAAQSKAIKLEAGRAYYIEAVHQEGSGEDFVGVGWQRPDGPLERPIPGQFLSPIDASPDASRLADQIESQLVAPAKALANRGFGEAATEDVEQYRRELADLAAAAGRYEAALRSSLDQLAEALVAAEDQAVVAAFDRFDATPRWQRAQTMLLDGEESLLASLAGSHDVELITLDGSQSTRLWTPTTDRQPPAQLTVEPIATVTDLSSAVRERTGGSTDSERGEDVGDDTGRRTAVIVISDGRHNNGESPVALARVLGDRSVPVYPVSLGSTTAPKDLAILDVEAPQSVYKDDRVRGRILVADHMPPGRPFTVRIEHDGKTLWSKPLNTADVARRWVDYDFPIEETVKDQLAAVPEGLTLNALPMDMRVVIDAIEGEQRTDNNDAPLNIRATTQRRRVLVIDGRPRWETRYIRNLFERDERWEVNTIFVGPAAEHQELRRGEEPGEFPADRQQMLNYDLVVFGEVDAKRFEEDDLKLLREFVADRAGGLVLLDGMRGKLRGYADTPLGDLMPVKWADGADDAVLRPMTEPQKIVVTKDGGRIAALQLDGDTTQNAELWTKLPKPKRVVRATALPDTQTLLEAVRDDTTTPMLVYRRFGAGQVLYSASDEYWRWRYKVADRYHQRLWHQVANWIMEPPYAVSDRFVSLDAGGPVYGPGERAMIRARLRDAEGKPVVHATVQAVLWNGDERVATVTLEADEAAGGAFRGQSEALDGGDYRVTVEVTGFTEEQILAETRFAVRTPESGELALMTANEQLMRQVADASGGRFLREEQAKRLPELLEPLSAGKVVESETALWQSYWWFLPIIGLLSLEWWLRKRAGMI